MQCDMGTGYKPPQCSDVANGHPVPHREARHNVCRAPTQITDMLTSDVCLAGTGKRQQGVLAPEHRTDAHSQSTHLSLAQEGLFSYPAENSRSGTGI